MSSSTEGGHTGFNAAADDSTPVQQRQKLSLNITIPQLEVEGERLRRGSSSSTTTPVNKSHHELPNSSFSPRQFSPSNFESVLHLPSPLVTNGTWDTSRSPKSNFMDHIRDQRGTPDLKIGKLRQSNIPTGVKNDSFRIVSEMTPADVTKHSPLKPSFKIPNTRNFSSPLTPAYDKHLEKAKMEHEEKINTDNLKIDDTYTALDSNGKVCQYNVLRKIGKGSFSVVLLAEDHNHCKVAIKISTVPDVQQTRSRVESSMKRELQLLREINHPNIIAILLSKIQNDEIVIIMPYCLGGDLYSFASTYRNITKPQLLRKMFANLVNAVRFLHHKDVVHRDIKLENALLNYYQDELLDLEVFDSTLPPLVVLTDFGLSRKLESPTELLTTRCGSEDYVSPELMMGIPYDGKKNDVWALGVLLYSLLESRLPFDQLPASANSHVSSASQRMRQTSAHRILLIDWDWYTFKDAKLVEDYKEWEGAKEIVEKCLVRKDKRCTIDDIAQMNWVRDYI